MNINQYIDHTLLKPQAVADDINTLCEEAISHNFYAVCLNGCYVAQAVKLLQHTAVKVAAVIGFPLGAMATKAKVFEATQAIADGADEIDMVLNIGWLKAGDHDSVEKEIKEIKTAIGEKVLKVIIETCFLNGTEKKVACQLCVNAGADFVKTSTGFGTGGATMDDIELMKEEVGNMVKIKASGGIKDYATAKAYVDLGVSRIGTSSGVAIMLASKS
ncbi:deoxyribose-phosphate aldolase [Aquimarina intermedia]|uniref:Deoxyribose-phosphate aldolase n=1 Tax=Aquimarina intermedia TaxID=350814 RepID=A0A5S5C8G8_9FLAO|nr:deoxyribose-phosphate aldolase [Aquimarina intermedia]TYP74283.1 deoxyribose-phosphate aldolase [Aquimarina intermedia]